MRRGSGAVGGSSVVAKTDLALRTLESLDQKAAVADRVYRRLRILSRAVAPVFPAASVMDCNDPGIVPSCSNFLRVPLWDG